jgi:hypothetical protein
MTEALRVQIERQHSKVFKHIMDLVFAQPGSEEMLFLPFSFLKQELIGDAYCAIIKQQNTYPENRRHRQPPDERASYLR